MNTPRSSYRRAALLLGALLCSAYAQAADALETRIAAARAKLEAAAQELAALHGQQQFRGPSAAAPNVFMVRPERAFLGVVPAAVAQRGARVIDVVPSSGAARAGLRAGDLLTHVRGQSLAVDDPVQALVRTMRASKPGERVEVRFLRDGAPQTAQLQTNSNGANPALFGFAPATAVGGVAAFNVMLPGGVQLAPMTAGLARYFGSERGVLVVSGAGAEGDGLQDGDVILRIAGRDVTGVADVLPRLVGAPGDGGEERVEVEVLRERAQLTLSVPRQKPHGLFAPFRARG